MLPVLLYGLTLTISPSECSIPIAESLTLAYESTDVLILVQSFLASIRYVVFALAGSDWSSLNPRLSLAFIFKSLVSIKSSAPVDVLFNKSYPKKLLWLISILRLTLGSPSFLVDGFFPLTIRSAGIIYISWLVLTDTDSPVATDTSFSNLIYALPATTSLLRPDEKIIFECSPLTISALLLYGDSLAESGSSYP